jgi:hypothetical protein
MHALVAAAPQGRRVWRSEMPADARHFAVAHDERVPFADASPHPSPCPPIITVDAGWVLLWYAALKDIGFFRDIMGINK